MWRMFPFRGWKGVYGPQSQLLPGEATTQVNLAIGDLCRLPDPKTYIRLLQLISACRGQPLEFRVTEKLWPPDVSYHAVSYVWGTKEFPGTVMINGRRFSVRRNCQKALAQACAYGESEYYWIDALCIDQQNRQEKAVQVQLMGSIFEKAKKVMSCIGDDENDSEVVINMLATAPESLIGEEWPGLYFGWRALCWLRGRPTDEIQRVSEGLAAMLRRPYFTRVWIIQEVFRKQSNTVLCCGDKYVSLKALFALKRAFFYSQQRDLLYQAARWFLDASLMQGRFQAISDAYANYDFPSRCSSFLLDVSFSKERFSNAASGRTSQGGKDGLEEILDMVSSFGCSDPRDQIYGTLPLIDWRSQTPIRPDYNKSRFDLALEVLRLGWPRGKYGTMASVINLTTIFRLFEPNAHPRQLLKEFHETSNAILERCHLPQIESGQTRDFFTKRRLRPRWQEIESRNLDHGGTVSCLSALGNESEAVSATADPQTPRQTRLLVLSPRLIFHVRANGGDVLPVNALHLHDPTGTSNGTTEIGRAAFYDLYFVPADALLVAFLTTSMGKVPELEIRGFLERLRSQPYEFLSYAQEVAEE